MPVSRFGFALVVSSALLVGSLSTACTPPADPPSPPAGEPGSATSAGVPSTEEAPKPPLAPSAEEAPKPPAAPEKPLQKPASKLTFGGASLSTIDVKQAVAAFKKAGFEAEPSSATASSFGNRAGRWDTLEFELTPKGSKQVLGSAEIVRPAKSVRAVPPEVDADRSAAGTVKRFEKMTQGLLDGGGVYDAESETSFSVVISTGGKDKKAVDLVKRITAKAP